ncbi:unnamed protein product [Phytophthora lilii]|uniref:Unnamed protein product n=1 Tax=Phytophthora lilii TaxID=2077276 RepID=A0A9W6WUI8_9STRA|nr:unnamed protein product [Phytophthora lilii]
MKDVSERNAPARRPPKRDGSEVIKGFVQEAEQRRVACRGLTPRPPGHRQTHGPSRPNVRTTERYPEDDRQEVRSGAPVSRRSNQEDEDTAAVVEGLFTTKHVQRNRQISLTPAMLPAVAAAAGSGLGVNNKPIFTFTRRKLQMESVNSQTGTAGPSASPRNNESPRRVMLPSPTAVAVTTSQQLGHRPRASNLSAKLDAILRSSPWMRRKVVMQPQMRGNSQRGLSNASTLRLLASHSTSPVHNHHEAIDASSGNANENHHRQHRKIGHYPNEEDASEMEKRIMVTFQRCDSSMSPASGSNGVAGRYGGKLRRELDAQSSNVASILSRRMIGEVPALKFFDEGEPIQIDQNAPDPMLIAAAAARARSFAKEENEDELSSPGVRKPTKPYPRTIGDLMVSSVPGTSPHRRATPRGVCYTLDASGCRRIKMQSGALTRANRYGGRTSHDHHKKKEEITLLPIALIVSPILLSLAALRQAERERMLSKRLSLLLSNNVELPPHMAAKELALARLRYKKANLQASCQTLAVLGAALHHVETAGEVSGLEISSGEQHFLELLRCAVEGDHAMTPLLIEGIMGQFNAEQRQKPLVAVRTCQHSYR